MFTRLGGPLGPETRYLSGIFENILGGGGSELTFFYWISLIKFFPWFSRVKCFPLIFPRKNFPLVFPSKIPEGGFFFESEGIQRAGTILEQLIFAWYTVLI